ncbi:unnamed protein product [Coffea canephora]|uniref:Uncharacterized protein n=1 Tax=Coffea canephora TaxID=49390 RepID=A0A068TVX3_COFCA|nr:unnamed protein product [Coffea canephora]
MEHQPYAFLANKLPFVLYSGPSNRRSPHSTGFRRSCRISLSVHRRFKESKISKSLQLFLIFSSTLVLCNFFREHLKSLYRQRSCCQGPAVTQISAMAVGLAEG